MPTARLRTFVNPRRPEFTTGGNSFKQEPGASPMADRLTAVLFVVILLAGCSSQDAAPSPGPKLGLDPSEPDAAAPTPTFSNPAASRTGSMHGTVQAPKGPVADAIVTLAGYPFAAATAPNGTFAFSGLTPGNYTVNVRAPGFTPAEKEATVQEGRATQVNMDLVADTSAQAGPLLADFWQGRTEVVVADGTYGRSTGDGAALDAMDFVPAVMFFCRSTPQSSEEQLIPIVFDDIHQLAWPGTAQVKVEVSWDPLMYPGNIHLQLDPRPGVDMAVSPDIPNGGSHTFDIPAEWADSPYQRFSTWLLGICPGATHGMGSHLYQWPQVIEFDAKVTFVRGHPLPPLAPPRDVYGNDTSMVIVDEARSDDGDLYARAYFAAPHDRTNTAIYRFEPTQGTLVPPGTAYVEAYLEWDWGGGDVSLSYVSAALHPQFQKEWSNHIVPEPVESGPNHKLYRIALTADDWDGPDDNRTAWRFFWNQAGQEAETIGTIPPEPWTIGLRVVAFSAAGLRDG